jgi:phage tail-like protein
MPVTGPFENRRFLVVTGNAAIPGISNVSSLQWTADVITVTEGGSHISISEPGKINYQPLTIEREVSFDPFFEDWARLVAGHGSEPGSIFKNLIIKIFDPADQLVVAYNVYRCFPTPTRPFPRSTSMATSCFRNDLCLSIKASNATSPWSLPPDSINARCFSRSSG